MTLNRSPHTTSRARRASTFVTTGVGTSSPRSVHSAGASAAGVSHVAVGPGSRTPPPVSSSRHTAVGTARATSSSGQAPPPASNDADGAAVPAPSEVASVQQAATTGLPAEAVQPTMPLPPAVLHAIPDLDLAVRRHWALVSLSERAPKVGRWLVRTCGCVRVYKHVSRSYAVRLGDCRTTT